jgi:hypothetical protein
VEAGPPRVIFYHTRRDRAMQYAFAAGKAFIIFAAVSRFRQELRTA